MVVIVALALFLLIFFLIKKHTGPAHLAMIAGLSVYELFGRDFAEWILRTVEGANAPIELIEMGVYVVLVAVFPLILYFRSDHGGLGGVLRAAEALVFSAILVSLLSAPLAYFFPFDSLALEIAEVIHSIEGPIVLAGVLSAYFDILVYH